MQNNYFESVKKEISELEEMLKECGIDIEEYSFVPLSFSFAPDNKTNLIGIDKNLVETVKTLIKHDKKYLSALKMTAYHEIGHKKLGKDESLAEIYAINNNTLQDYIIEIAVISKIEYVNMSALNNTINIEDTIDYLLKHDRVDEWKNPSFIRKLNKFGFDENTVKKIKVGYYEIYSGILKETYTINRYLK